MSRRLLVAHFAREEDVLAATRAGRESGLRIVDVYTPYAVHGLDEAMGLRPSRLPWACFAFGLVGVGTAFWFQFWAMARSWPLDIGGKPWNSLPAYVPVAFELMVLGAGLGVVAAFLLRSRLLPGKEARPSYHEATNDEFILVLRQPATGLDSRFVDRLHDEFHAVRLDETA